MRLYAGELPHTGSAVRVLMISPLPPPYGGISHWTTNVLALCEERVDVKLLSLDTSPVLRRSLTTGFVGRLVQGGPQIVYDVVRALVRLLVSRPHVVHLNTSGSLALVRDLVVMWICTIRRVPVVLHLRFGRVPILAASGGWEWSLFQRVAGRAARVIALDESTERTLVGQGLPCIRIPNFVDVTSVLTAQDRDESVLFVGWVTESKGVLDLIEAWTDAALDGWRLDIVGPLGDERAIQGLTRRVEGNIEFVGELSNRDVRQRMINCGIFVLPSHTEGFPNVVVEAMAVGAPIIASDVGAIPEMLQGGAGIVVAAKRPADLKAALTHLAADGALRAQLGQAAHERSRLRYSAAAVIESYVALWQDLAGRTPSI